MKLLNKTDIRKERFNIVLLMCCTIFYLLLPLCGTIVYSTADDYMFILITSGAYTGIPSPYTIFEGYLYSSLIASLYKLTNQLEWFSLVQHFLSVLSFVVISWYLLKSRIKPSLIYCFYSVFFVVQFFILLSPNFTLCAAELSLASLIILLNGRGNIKYGFFALLLFLIGAEIRFQAVFLPLLVLFPIFLCSQRKKFYCSKEFLHTSIFLVCMVVGAFISRAYSNYVYNSDDWNYYYKYNNARGFLNDNPNAIDAAKLLDDDNKKKEYDLILNYRVNDGNIVNAEELDKCAKYIIDNYSNSMISNMTSYILMIITYDGLWALVVCAFLFYEMICKRNYKILMILLWGIMSVLLACMLMASSTFAKARTIIPLLSALYFLMVWCSMQIQKRYFNYILVAFSLIVFLHWGYRVNIIYHHNSESISAVENVNSFLSNVPATKLLVHTKVPICGEAFHYSQSPIAQKLVRSGWLTNAPITKVHYAGFKSYTQGLPYLYNKTQNEFIEKTQSLLKSYYGIDTERVVISENEDFVVEKMVASTMN